MFLIKDSKSPYFQIVYYVDGKRTKKSTKKKLKGEAEKVFRRFLIDFNGDGRKTTTKTIPLSQFAEEYISYCKSIRSNSYIERSIIPAFKKFNSFTGTVSLNQISPHRVDKFITATNSYSTSAAGLYYRTLKAAFSKAVVWVYIQENPFKKIKAPKLPKCYPVYISEIELIQILNNTKSQLFKDIFTIAFYSGMRLGELMNMRWHWIDFKNKLITIKNSKSFNTKNKRERIIPIHPKINKLLKRRLNKQLQNQYVFYQYEGIKLNEDYISRQFKKAVRASDVNEKVHFHSLRHSFCSALVQRGVSLYAVKELAGHENITTTQIYSHLERENLSQAVNLL
jgi:integrase